MHPPNIGFAAVFIFRQLAGAEISSFFFSVPEANPVGLQHLTTRKSGAEANVVVGIRPGVVQIECKDPIGRTIVPITTP